MIGRPRVSRLLAALGGSTRLAARATRGAHASATRRAVDDWSIHVGTWNTWKSNGYPALWPQRRPSLVNTLTALSPAPDVLLIQENHPLILDAIFEALPHHTATGMGSDDHQGWTQEGGILYDTRVFTLASYGEEDIAQQEPLRRLFWARLRRLETAQGRVHHRRRPRRVGHEGKGSTVLVATAHFSWQGSPVEVGTDINVRRESSRRTGKVLQELAGKGEPVIFGGDLNESFWPARELRSAGFDDCFSQLSLGKRRTHPARPCGAADEDNLAEQCLDWIFSNEHARSVSARVVDDLARYGPSRLASSDHMPVVATFVIE